MLLSKFVAYTARKFDAQGYDMCERVATVKQIGYSFSVVPDQGYEKMFEKFLNDEIA